jgi:hypothetical protein
MLLVRIAWTFLWVILDIVYRNWTNILKIILHRYDIKKKKDVDFLAYFPFKGKWGLWDHQSVCVCVPPPQ